jgi:Flp pilus assembly protein TadG
MMRIIQHPLPRLGLGLFRPVQAWLASLEAGFGHRSRGLLASRRGSVAVEFVLASVPLMLLMFGFIASSAVFNTWSSMQANSQYAARMMSTGQIGNNVNGAFSNTNASSSTTCGSSLRNTQVEYYACAALPSWATFTVTTSENCAVPSVTVSLSASASAAAIADIENFFSGKTIVAQTVFMKEGTCP